MHKSASEREQQAARAALHRRLEPLHAGFFVDREYKRVLKLAEAQLKKDPKQPEMRIFAAMAKQRLGESREALALLTSVVRTDRPADWEYGVRYLRIALEGASEMALLAEAYEGAWAQLAPAEHSDYTGAAELIFFFHYCARDYAKAAKQTTQLKKLDPSDATRYTLWNVVTLYHQHLRAGPGAPPMYLTLCEKMLARLHEEGALKTGEDLSFYCSVLQTAGKLEAARALAQGPLAANAFPFEEERHKFVAALLRKLPDAKDALLQCYRDILALSPDDWEAWEGAINASAPHWEPVTELARAACVHSPKKRGPHLALLEVALRKGRVNERQGDGVAALVVDFFARFGNRACCWGDVGRYAVALDADTRRWLMEQLRAQLKPIDWDTTYATLPREHVASALDDPSDPHRHKRDGKDSGKVDQWSAEDEARQNEMMRRVQVAKLELTLEQASEPAALCNDLVRQFEAGCRLYRSHLEITEEGPNDDVALVAAHYLLRHLQRPLEAVAVCRTMLAATPYAFQPKLLAIEVAQGVGAYSYVRELYEGLEIKYVQHDSMGHFTLYAAVQSGDVAWVQALRDAAEDWFDVYVRRIGRDTFKCFENNKWTQIDGFERFEDRLRGSWHMTTLVVEALLAQQLQGGCSHEWDLEAVAAVVHASREAALTAAWRKSPQWLEEVLQLCMGANSGPLPLSYNYDRRVLPDFSSTALRTKAEWEALEWVVPAEDLAWLASRVLLALVLEAQAKGDTSPACERVAQLQAHWERVGDARDRLCGRECRQLAAALLRVYSLMVPVHTEPTLERIDCAMAALQAVIASAGAVRAYLAGGGPLRAGWSADVSFLAVQWMPLACVQVRTWRKLMPTKGARNRMDATCKARTADLTEAIKRCAAECAAFADAVRTLAVVPSSVFACEPVLVGRGSSLGDACAVVEKSFGHFAANVARLCDATRAVLLK